MDRTCCTAIHPVSFVFCFDDVDDGSAAPYFFLRLHCLSLFFFAAAIADADETCCRILLLEHMLADAGKYDGIGCRGCCRLEQMPLLEELLTLLHTLLLAANDIADPLRSLLMHLRDFCTHVADD
jgi:hypothetical protein